MKILNYYELPAHEQEIIAKGFKQKVENQIKEWNITFEKGDIDPDTYHSKETYIAMHVRISVKNMKFVMSDGKIYLLKEVFK
jgi:hypothetical protein